MKIKLIVQIKTNRKYCGDNCFYLGSYGECYLFPVDIDRTHTKLELDVDEDYKILRPRYYRCKQCLEAEVVK
jgi:hypothetical protein